MPPAAAPQDRAGVSKDALPPVQGRIPMTTRRNNGLKSLSGDDSALPEDERALLERARALIPRLAERAPAANAARQVPDATLTEYREAGILRILQPRRFGGRQG